MGSQAFLQGCTWQLSTFCMNQDGFGIKFLDMYFFSLLFLLRRSYYLSLYQGMTKRIVYSPVWPSHRADLPWAGQVLQWHYSVHVSSLRSFAHAMLSASNALPFIANLTDLIHPSEPCMGVSTSAKTALTSLHPFSHNFVLSYIHSLNHVYWILIMNQVNKINMVPVLAKLMM